MAEQALKSRSAHNEALSRALSETRDAAAAVEKTSSAAQEESSFLADSMAALHEEAAALKVALERAQREREHLAQVCVRRAWRGMDEGGLGKGE